MEFIEIRDSCTSTCHTYSISFLSCKLLTSTDPERFGLLNSTTQSANMERADITGSERVGNFISNRQARRNPPSQSHPHHLCHPHGHGPWHCHCLCLSLFLLFNQKPDNRFGIQREISPPFLEIIKGIQSHQR